MRTNHTVGLALALVSLPLACSANTLDQNARTHASVTEVTHRVHRPTPDEVGRAAGLKIRHDLELERQGRLTHTARRTMAKSAVRTESAARQRTESAQRTEIAARSSEAALTPEQRQRLAAEQRAAAVWRQDAAQADERAAPPARRETSTQLETERRTAQVETPSGNDPTPAFAQPMPRLVRTRLLLTAPPLKGSLASLERQNERLEAEGLERIEDEADLSSRIAQKVLIPVPVSDALMINPDLPAHHRYCRPWTARFLSDLAGRHAALFHKPLEVSSAVRTVVYQQHLRAINGNAAPAEGDVVSPHLTGATIDITKEGMSREEIGWMRRWLLPLEMAGKIDVEEEFEQACFHITVYKTYAPAKPAARSRRATAQQKAAPASQAAQQPAPAQVAG